MIENVIRLNSLYDYYGKLLSENQERSFYLYYRLDYSLSEISNEIGISKQGVSENLKRAVKELERYEEALSIVDKSSKLKHDLGKLEELLQTKIDLKDPKDEEISKLIRKIVEELED